MAMPNLFCPHCGGASRPIEQEPIWIERADGDGLQIGVLRGRYLCLKCNEQWVCEMPATRPDDWVKGPGDGRAERAVLERMKKGVPA